MIAIIDYGAGNIFSVKNALDYLGVENKLTNDKVEIENANGIILPGVGAFPYAMEKLNQSGLVEIIKKQAQIKPFLGICLGMQMLFEKGFEFEECDGLGLIKGEVVKMENENLIIPHMGWNKLEFNGKDCPVLEGLTEDEYVYFVHSYKAVCDKENIVAYSNYGGEVPALVSDGKYVFGAQFHPEKSGQTGLVILKNFAKMSGEVK